MTSSANIPDPPSPSRSWRTRLLLLAIGVVAGIFAASYLWHPAPPSVPPGGNAPPIAYPQLVVGSTAPDFTLHDAHGDPALVDTRVTLSQVTDQHLVLLVYYLTYSCRDCVNNLQMIADRKAQLDALHVQVLAVSPDTVAETRDSIEYYGDLPFPMLSDEDEKVARAYNLLDDSPPATTAASTSPPLRQGVFIIDRQRKIVFLARTTDPYEDLDGLLKVLQTVAP